MNIKEGYVYHIKDEYFSKVKDKNLMQNKEAGSYRPTYICINDKKTNLIWAVPMSTRTEKFKAIYNKEIKKYGRCMKIVLGEYSGKKAAFLLQNMFPLTAKYIDHIHTKDGIPVPIDYHTGMTINSNMKKLRALAYKGKNVVFPDINRLEKIMLAEIRAKKIEIVSDKKTSLDDKIANAKIKSEQHNQSNKTTSPHKNKKDLDR